MGRGRGNKSRTMRKHFRDGRENAWKKPRPNSPTEDKDPRPENPSWQPFATQNNAFEEYYKEQGVVEMEEWDTFLATLRTPLPASFRINSCGQFCEDIKLQLESDFSNSLHSETIDGSEIEGIKPLPWYPDKLAWHSNFSRMQLRKTQSLERFHEFLKLENEIGNITRQEAVSMVPPLFLDVHPDHFILDMCAAPGSKTFQLLEIMYQSMTPGVLPEGVVVANDVDVQRCNLLIHQTKRMCTANLIVTNNEAQQFPSCRSNRGCCNGVESEFKPPMSQLLFDRVLCDVPCSGDGTLRKAPDMWRKWNSSMGNGLHGLQLQIAMQGVSLLKVGGKMVYSTCSMNPVEDEAVVAEILRRCGGAIELADVSKNLPELARRPGLKSWKVWDKGVWLCSHRDAVKHRKFGAVPSMFPSGRSYSAQAENNFDDAVSPPVALADDLIEVSELPLERCMRIVPHDQNCGAFFIAVLEKVSPMAAQQKLGKREKSNSNGSSSPATVEGEQDSNPQAPLPDSIGGQADAENGSEPDENGGTKLETTSPQHNIKRKVQMQGRWKGVDPVLFFNDADVINGIKLFYGISSSFPLEGHLISRNMDSNSVKRIYYISQSVKNVLELNFLAGHQLKISSVGLKMFERQSAIKGDAAACKFRISSEGLPVILPHITKQILYASPEDFEHILKHKSVKFGEFLDSEFGEEAAKLLMGCCVVVLKDGEEIPGDVGASTIAIGCWKGRGSLSVMVTALDCQELLQRLSVRFRGTGTSVLPHIQEAIAS